MTPVTDILHRFKEDYLRVLFLNMAEQVISHHDDNQSEEVMYIQTGCYH